MTPTTMLLMVLLVVAGLVVYGYVQKYIPSGTATTAG